MNTFGIQFSFLISSFNFRPGNCYTNFNSRFSMIVGTLYIVAQWVMEGQITAKQSGIWSLLSMFPPPSLHWALLPWDAVHYEVVADNSSRTSHPLSQPILLEHLPSNAEVPAVGSWKRESKDLPLCPSRRMHDMENALAAWNRNTNLENWPLPCDFWTCLKLAGQCN